MVGRESRGTPEVEVTTSRLVWLSDERNKKKKSLCTGQKAEEESENVGPQYAVFRRSSLSTCTR